MGVERVFSPHTVWKTLSFLLRLGEKLAPNPTSYLLPQYYYLVGERS